jgi:hypothetical protein
VSTVRCGVVVAVRELTCDSRLDIES